jgi:GAF domain-containing protein
MRKRLAEWIRPGSVDPELAHRQYLLNIILLGLAAPGLLFGLVMLVLWLMGLAPPAGAISGLGVQPFYFLAYWLGRRGRVTLAAFIPTTVVFLVMVGSFFQVGLGHVSTVGLAMVVVTAGILMGAGAAGLFMVLSVAAYLAAGWAQMQGLIPTALPAIETVAIDAVGLGLGLAVLVLFEWVSAREIRKALQTERRSASLAATQSRELETLVRERTRSLERRALQLQTAADIARLATEEVELEDLLRRAVHLIQDRFGMYYVAIFLLDETGTWANLAAGTGQAGQRLLARSHRLAVGSASLVGWVTANLQPRLSQDVEEDPYHFRNPLLPETRSEITVPLRVGDRLLGALDIQSKEAGAFHEEEIPAYEALADELAFAIEKARAMRNLQRELMRFESTYREQARQSWVRFARILEEARVHISSPLAPAQEQATFETRSEATRLAETAISEDGREVTVPISMRGQVVATMSARRSAAEDPWSEEDIALLEAIASQTALALESARQYAEEHRRVAELEVINRISQAVSQHLQLDSLYRVVHNQVNQVLGETDLYIGIYDPEGNTISFPYISQDHEVKRLPPAPLGEDLASLVIQTRQPLLIQEDAERRARALGAELGTAKAKSWLGVPLMVGDEIIGIMAVMDRKREYRFSEDDAALLGTLASQIATALQNARLLEEVQRRARRDRLIREIATRVRRAPDMPSVMRAAAHELRRALNASAASIRLKRPQGGDGKGSGEEGEP